MLNMLYFHAEKLQFTRTHTFYSIHLEKFIIILNTKADTF